MSELRQVEAELHHVLAEAEAERLFTGAAVEFGGPHGVTRAFVGRHGVDQLSAPVDEHSIFDLASLTKVLATTSVMQLLVSNGQLNLNDPVGRWLEGWMSADRAHVTLNDLLAHTAGLAAHVPLYESRTGLSEFVRAISEMPLAYEPHTRGLYSDLGFILLADISERASGRGFVDLVDSVLEGREIGGLTFCPDAAVRARCVTTGFDAWRGRELVGEVHDRNAAALGGVAGHAGLFGTLSAVGRAAQALVRELTADHPVRLARLFATRQTVEGSSRALGWDTMMPTSSCGPNMSPGAIGHTGFTGTSVWIDWERRGYSVLLTNRVATSASAEAIQALRRSVHTLCCQWLS